MPHSASGPLSRITRVAGSYFRDDRKKSDILDTPSASFQLQMQYLFLQPRLNLPTPKSITKTLSSTKLPSAFYQSITNVTMKASRDTLVALLVGSTMAAPLFHNVGDRASLVVPAVLPRSVRITSTPEEPDGTRVTDVGTDGTRVTRRGNVKENMVEAAVSERSVRITTTPDGTRVTDVGTDGTRVTRAERI